MDTETDTFDTGVPVHRSASSSTAVAFVVILATLLVVFSFEYPIATNITEFASINTEDIAILLVSVVSFVVQSYRYRWDIKILLPQVTFVFLVLSAWILVTLFVAVIRSEVSIAASALWTFKWFEALILFFALQNLLDRRSAKWVVQTLLWSGMIIGLYSAYVAVLGRFRVRIFFGNPNTLAAFMTLAAILAAAHTLYYRDYWIKYGFVTLVAIIGVFTTGSRSGILGLCVGLLVLVALMRRQLGRTGILSMGAAVGLTITVLPFVVPKIVINRLTGWISFSNGTIQLTDSFAAESFRTRFELTQESLNLFIQQPVFGYGWFAVPSRVGYTDVYYTTILVEIGLVGLLLVGVLSLLFVRVWFNVRRTGAVAVGSAGVAWYVGLLFQSIGGTFPRTPQVLFISILFLIAARVASRDHAGQTLAT